MESLESFVTMGSKVRYILGNKSGATFNPIKITVRDVNAE